MPASARGEDNQVEKLRHVLHSARIEHPTGAEIPRRVQPDSPGEYLAKNYDDTYAERFAVEFAVRLKSFVPRSVLVCRDSPSHVDKKHLGRLFLSKCAEASRSCGVQAQEQQQQQLQETAAAQTREELAPADDILPSIPPVPGFRRPPELSRAMVPGAGRGPLPSDRYEPLVASCSC